MEPGIWISCRLAQDDRKRQKYYSNFDGINSSHLANDYYATDYQAVW